MNPQPAAPQTVVDAVRQVVFGPASGFQNLTIFPLLSREEREVDYLTLDEALAGGWVQITEVSDAGQVSELAEEGGDGRLDNPVVAPPQHPRRHPSRNAQGALHHLNGR